VIIHGTPDAVLDQIHGLEAEIGLNYLMCAPLSHETFTLLAEKVVPKLI
jgi:alkanesulfonate monooxygenase SsuD/methylene tetrahydromethanopterin reductase-like flavin-dependent oxidoreductase (luciferase family)